MDHLEGIVFLDRLSRLKRQMVLKKSPKPNATRRAPNRVAHACRFHGNTGIFGSGVARHSCGGTRDLRVYTRPPAASGRGMKQTPRPFKAPPKNWVWRCRPRKISNRPKLWRPSPHWTAIWPCRRLWADFAAGCSGGAAFGVLEYSRFFAAALARCRACSARDYGGRHKNRHCHHANGGGAGYRPRASNP